ncbi:PSP1 domain-containing protein [Deinococcus roseus]|uniref:PSP1 C-terminal domain-containing protein n=1 Tax=Deinococcus roseus TaxID=392414 RepID=A0ABQ2CYY0_9DEIO|nr:stage 0 sporulation family protein [Deinococcus roseus]GGJ34439.1 hypothetical protein GCM10008938_20790 [Deinococcus roseus]
MFTQAVRFDNGPKLHPMSTETLYPVNSHVIVQSRRGLEVALVRTEHQDTPRRDHGGSILRSATPEDLQAREENQKRAEEVKWYLRAKVRARKLPVKIVSVEFTLDQSLLTMAYSAEERVELSSLIADLRHITPAKVNFFAVGPREQAATLGALGMCGRESCSSTHLQEFAPVSIRMARDQQLPLNPEKLSGPCGRLLCCLQYEHEMYQELLSELPRKNAKMCHTESGACGKVVKLSPLRGTLELLTEDGSMIEGKPEEFSKL